MNEADPKTVVMQTGVATSATRERTPPRAWICRVVTGDNSGTMITLGLRPVVVGAGRHCDLVLHDPAVSRRHAEITVTLEGVKVRDLKSTNGTYYQSSRITEVVVPSDATLRMGSTTLRLSASSPQTVSPSSRSRFGGLVGDSLVMREVFAILELASPSDTTVLIEGESGTGKEVAARAIHDHSRRAEQPFVVVDCGATHEQLIESQLFGHIRGAFTGAVSERKGAFLEASAGTLFLDEVGELPSASQAKLLRAIEARTVQPLGSDRPISVAARVIAATNRDLHQMVEEKKFRFDLFYRLAVIHLRIPALRERSEDIPILVRHFYEGRGVDPGVIAGENLRLLQEYDWPGNVRELRNVVERAWVLGGIDGAGFDKLHLELGGGGAAQLPTGEVISTSLPFKEAKERWLQVFERRYIGAVYATHSYNVSKASEQAGINRNHFRKLLEKHGLLRQ